MEPVTSVEFYFDPMCPWAFQTSKWIRAVRAELGIDVAWRFFSLEEINRAEGKKHPWERPWSFGWSQMRIGAWLRRRSEQDVDRWYAAVGEAFHERGVRTHRPDVHRDLVSDLGYPPSTVDDAIADPTTADEVRADHEYAVTAPGAHGVPTLVLRPGGHALYGPSVAPAPAGAAAARLWEIVTAWREFPHLYELRHPKTAADLGHVAGLFGPYLGARDWGTLERPAP